MISQVLLIAMMAAGPSDLAAARTNYSKCLGSYTRAQVKEGVSAEAFQANIATVCKAEETSFRSASIAVDLAARIPRATAEQNVTDEIGYIYENAVETFKASLPEAAPK
jgi:hypothetical protein